MRSVRPVRDDDFVDVVLGAAAPVVVGCTDTWSDAASPLGALLDGLAVRHDWLLVARLDASRSPRTAAAYGVGAGPAVLVFEAGQLVATRMGVPTEEDVTRALTARPTPVARPAGASRPSPTPPAPIEG